MSITKLRADGYKKHAYLHLECPLLITISGDNFIL